MDDSGENEKAEEALTRGPEDCHLRHPRPNIRTCPILSIMFSLGLGVPIRSLIAIKSPLQRSRPRHRTPRRAAAEESSCRQGTSSSPSWTRRRPEEEGRAQLPAVGRAAARQERHHRDDGGRHDVREDRRVRGGEPHQEVLQGVQTLQELHNLAAPGGGVYRLQRSAARPRCKLTIVPTWSGRRSRLLLCSAVCCCSTLSRLPADHQAPRHRRRTRGGP